MIVGIVHYYLLSMCAYVESSKRRVCASSFHGVMEIYNTTGYVTMGHDNLPWSFNRRTTKPPSHIYLEHKYVSYDGTVG